MRHDKIIAAHSARPQACIFICTCCEAHEHRATADAPEGWEIEYIDGTGYPLCADCKIDLPGGHLTASGLATGAGVVSQLDEAELFDCDDEALAHAARLAGIARAERIGKSVLPMLLVAIALIGTASIVQHSIRWVMM